MIEETPKGKYNKWGERAPLVISDNQKHQEASVYFLKPNLSSSNFK